MKRVEAAIEPQLMARHMLLPEDDRVRQTDVPERELLDPLLQGDPLDLDACAQCVTRVTFLRTLSALQFT